jgi:hypothetical protein
MMGEAFTLEAGAPSAAPEAALDSETDTPSATTNGKTRASESLEALWAYALTIRRKDDRFIGR